MGTTEGDGNGKRADMWRGAFIALLASMATIVVGWMTVGGKLVSREELRGVIDEEVKVYNADHDEYGRAKQSIDERLARADQLGSALTSVLTEQAKTNVKLDAVLDRLKVLEDRQDRQDRAIKPTR